ncbi:hypothetical protein PV703_11475 [Streptomyces sp. ME01-24h]|nr:hypothetical protein [Streptomyces sp. ME01-24h]
MTVMTLPTRTPGATLPSLADEIELAYIERDEQLAAAVRAEIEMAGGADNVPALPPLPPPPPKADDDVVVHLATRRIQNSCEFRGAVA